MTSYRIAVTDLQAGKSTAANTATASAIDQDMKTTDLLLLQNEKCGSS